MDCRKKRDYKACFLMRGIAVLSRISESERHSAAFAAALRTYIR